MGKLKGLLGDVVNKGDLLVGKALEPDLTLGEAVSLGDGDRANLVKRKWIEKPAVEANKRVAKSTSPMFIQQRWDKPSTKPAVIPPVMAKPSIVPPVMKENGKKDIVEIEESEADEGGESSDSEEGVSDSEEEETPPASTKQKTTKLTRTDAQWKTREAVQEKIFNGREKGIERRGAEGKERDREKEKAKQQEKEKEKATRTRTSLPQANGGKVGLDAR
ncbi:hypothetical protein BGX38DRAFT_1309233 [Terfezia claveryi]|nr:hypothetical protein BGX38DRAFT_1309233 [Terfezia claveryi]